MKRHALTLIIFSALSTPAFASLAKPEIDTLSSPVKNAFLDDRRLLALQNAIDNGDEMSMLDSATPEELKNIYGIQEVVVADKNGELKLTPSIENSLSSGVQIDVNLAEQTLTATDADGTFSTKISSARPGFTTAKGCYDNPQLEQVHPSRKLDNSPVPHSIFYSGGFAIHGTLDDASIGRPASYGGIRVSRYAASVIYGLIEYYGTAKSKVCVF